MSRIIKHNRTLQVNENRNISIEGWLSYNIQLVGDVPARIGNSKKLEVTDDVVCKDSDGIPFGSGNYLEIAFDEVEGTKLATIEYTVIECCN